MNKSAKRILSIFLSLMLVIGLLSGCKALNKSGASEESFSNLKSSVSGENILEIVNQLSSEKYDGRLAGSNGNKLTEDYIADYFKKIGLDSPRGIENYRQSYTQPSIILNTKPVINLVNNKKNTKEFEFLKDFQTAPNPNTRIKGEETAPLYLLKDTDALSNSEKDMYGKFLLIPQNISSDPSQANKLREKTASIKNLKGLIFERDLNSRKLEVNHFMNPVYAPPQAYYDDRAPIVAYFESSSFKVLETASQKDEELHIKIDYTYKEIQLSNIMGVIPGSDSKLKDEYIIISGHFDHLGNNKNGTYNPGALDNSSGTAAVMEVARAIKESKIKTKKSILFIAFNGEEEGLYGSSHFASKPVCDLNKSVMINMDMIGHKNDKPLTFYSTKDSKLIEDLMSYAKKLDIAYTTDKGDRSDHAPIEAKGANAVTLIEMEMAEYHSYRDTPDKLDKNDLKRVVDLIVYYISQKA